MSSEHFRYVCTLRGHEADVRGLCMSTNEGILSCSRDLTTKLWTPDDNGQHYEANATYTGHTKFVSCVATMEPVKDIYPDGLILTGSNDSNINVYLPVSADPIMTLSGHSNAVSTITSGSFGIIFSGSWDKTARMWLIDTSGTIEGKCAIVMSGHEAAVWDVLIIPGQKGAVLTASADKSIRLWKAGKCLKVFTGHNDCVRGLAAISSSEFLSCSNDASIKRWSVDGDCLQTYYGHKNFVYSIAYCPEKSEFVSSSEDRTVKVWSIRQGNPIQTIATPAQSVWKIVILPNGDIAFGGSDATIRIFSRSTSRVANLKENASYEEELSRAAIPESGNDLGDIKVDDLPGVEVLEKAGKTDGQTQMVRSGSVVEAYQWSMADQKWLKIGDVVGSSGKGKKSMYNGKEYDYVFTVDIKEGSPALHLPYNLTEDPWFAAQKFIDDNDLSQGYLDQVAGFIIDNTKGADTSYQNTSQYSDPFTGQGRYEPTDSNAMDTSGSDPYTGGGRYKPSSDDDRMTQDAPLHDPMLNPSRYVPSGGDKEADKPKSSIPIDFAPRTNKYFPKSGYILFETKNVSAMFAKLKECASKSGNMLSDDDVASLESITNTDSEFNLNSIEILWKALHWNEDFIFPVLDLLRCSIICRPEIIQMLCDSKTEELLELLLKHLQIDSSTVIASNRMLSVRILCNLFCSGPGCAFLLAGCDRIIDAVGSLVRTANNNTQIAIATLFIDFAVFFNTKSNSSDAIASLCSDARLCCLRCVSTYVAVPQQIPPEALFRHLVALGTLLTGHEMAKGVAQSLNVKEYVQAIASMNATSEKISECGEFLLRLI